MRFLKTVYRQHRLIYLLLALKVFLFYMLTDRLDMMWILEVPAITFLILAAVYEFFSLKENRFLRWGFTIIYTFITLVMFADAAYSSYFGRYISVNQIYQLSSFRQIATDGNVVSATVNPLCLLALADLPPVLHWYRLRNRGNAGMISGLFSARTVKSRVVAWGFVLVRSVLFAAVLCLWYYYGFNPQNLRSVQQVNHIEHFTYHTNDILVNVVGKMHRGDVDKEELQARIKELVPKSSGDAYHGVAKGRNLILIQTESLNDFVVGATYNGQEITPNLNRLLGKDTLYFDHFYSTTGVGNTSDAEFSVLNSLYANDERECYRMYVDNTFHGLPWMLRDEGYEAMAFHGYIKTFWNREEAYKNQGFSHFYSEEELDVTEVSGFGLTDKEMFRQAVDILAEKKQPYFAFMITLTNHIPYELDQDLASLNLLDRDKGSTFGNYLQTVRYTDEAFGKLIDLLKKKDMYDNTMIVIYGDHQGLNKETPAVSYKMREYLGRDYDFDEMLNVPLIIHIPGLNESRTLHNVGGQVDVMPTIANLMDLDPGQPYVFGHDLLNSDEGFLAQISYVGKGSFISGNGNRIFVIGKDGTVENGRTISLTTGAMLPTDTDQAQADSDRALALLSLCREALDYNLIADYILDTK